MLNITNEGYCTWRNKLGIPANFKATVIPKGQKEMFYCELSQKEVEVANSFLTLLKRTKRLAQKKGLPFGFDEISEVMYQINKGNEWVRAS